MNLENFEYFRQLSNESQVLNETLEKIVKDNNIDSILDIGAGNGLLAKSLSSLVEDYWALEPDSILAEKLEKEGLKVINESWPLDINKKFSLVLSSHSIYYIDDYIEFIEKALAVLKDKGLFILITYLGGPDNAWEELLKELDIFDDFNIKYSLENLSEEMGNKYKKEVINKTISIGGDRAEDVFKALSFMAQEEGKYDIFNSNKSKILEILDKRYRSEEKYIFPFKNNLLIFRI